MPTSLREQVLAAFTTKFGNISSIAGLSIERNRSAAVVKYPSLLIYDANESLINDNSVYSKVTMTIIVLGLVQASTDALIGPTINELYAQTIKAAVSDTGLGGLAIDIRLNQSDFEFEDNPARPQASFRAEFSIDYWMNTSDPYTIPPP